MPRKSLIDTRRLQRETRRISTSMETFGKDILKNIATETEAELRSLLKDAKERAPVDTGRLRDSGHLVRSASARGIRFEVAFGGASVRGEFVDYATIVHETHPSKAKFLERAANASLPGLADRIATKMGR